MGPGMVERETQDDMHKTGFLKVIKEMVVWTQLAVRPVNEISC